MDCLGDTPLPIPSCLIGKLSVVRPKWRSITRRAVKSLCWETALADEPWLDVRDAPGHLVLGGGRFFEGENVLLAVVVEELERACYWSGTALEEAYPVMKEMILGGLEVFWFCLAALGDAPVWIAPCESFKREKASIARTALAGLLRWWPAFCALSDRFCSRMPGFGGWETWGLRVFYLCKHLGCSKGDLEQLASVDAVEGARLLRTWVDSRDTPSAGPNRHGVEDERA